MLRRPAITALLNGQAVKIGLGSMSVTSNRGSARRNARAHVAPANPPPRMTMRAFACAKDGFGNSATAAAAPLRNARRVAPITAEPSMLFSHPGGDRPDLVVGEALRNASHYR